MPRRSSTVPKEVFLSHASKDRRFTNRIADMLRDQGLRVWYSRTHIRGAQQWHDEIGSALARCDWFLLVISPQATKSRWVKRELLYALNSPRYDGRIVPVIHRACEIDALDKLSWTLQSFQHVDFSRSFDGGRRELLRMWQK